jgi:hypothetical protein
MFSLISGEAMMMPQRSTKSTNESPFYQKCFCALCDLFCAFCDPSSKIHTDNAGTPAHNSNHAATDTEQ